MLLTEAGKIWQDIVRYIFRLPNPNEHAQAAVLAISSCFTHEDMDKIFVPLKLEIKKGTVNPHLLIQARV